VDKLFAGSKIDLVKEDTEKKSYENSSLDINGAKEETKSVKAEIGPKIHSEVCKGRIEAAVNEER